MKLPELNITLSPRARRILALSGYPLFYLFCLVLFAYFTFPYERLKERILVEFEAQRGGGPSPQHLEIESLGPYWFSGLSATGVRLTSPRPPGPDGDRPASKVVFDKAHARISLFPLLIGRVSLSFGAKAFGGEIDGWTRTNSDGRKLELELSGVDIGAIDPIVDTVGLPMTGTLQGKIDLSIPEQKLVKATGTIELSVADLTAGDGKAKLQGKLALPKLNVGQLDLAGDTKDGIVKFTKFGAQGKISTLPGRGR